MLANLVLDAPLVMRMLVRLDVGVNGTNVMLCVPAIPDKWSLRVFNVALLFCCFPVILHLSPIK